ncbi:peptide chain release factor N(5)-glutamine methyltransferase [Taibaiella lutea]|uniref:peptide chain release factor N(5)-glutamine methyltransferase n=1 Tax=Taibaiella lutea TaxID=2608001 RepID=A0A5M6CR34_9BACT|nr:peptide chain release factor N(5)-glutamine methyltransferase [Taibaiella lutea]KAA5536412.1 peptide chain release factor N(5)-glutamine methyltransferase [Taibaiella lutea]
MTIQDAHQYLTERLQTIYDVSEAENITVWVLESLTGFTRLIQKMNAKQELTDLQQAELEGYINELLQHRPVQYVLGECYFMDMKLFVDENVLVPRPETEELVDWIIKYCQSQNITEPAILDIGTGSGCIALALKKHIPESKVTAIDIAEGALNIAKKNANDTGLEIDWRQNDILDKATWGLLPEFDVIVSNPPYITLQEKETILPNVLQYEPHQALFVTNNDAQQFYKAIEGFAQEKMHQSGVLFMELHRDFAKETQSFYNSRNWHTTLRKDMQENDRMLMAWKS